MTLSDVHAVFYVFLMVLRTNRINSLVFIMKECIVCVGTEFVFHPFNL